MVTQGHFSALPHPADKAVLVHPTTFTICTRKQPVASCDQKGGKLSNSDSFIDEVAEEVRRDKLYIYIRRYGWIAVILVLLVVGGAAWNEYRKAQERGAAQATGDALLEALNQDDMAARADAIAQVDASGPSTAVASLLTAATQEEAGDYAAATATLGALASNGDIPETYRELAQLETGDAEAAKETLRQIVEDAGIIRGLRERVQTLMVALGEPIPDTETE